jgi:hypothetical protein
MGTRNGLVYNIYMNEDKVNQSVKALTILFGIILAITFIAAIVS